MEIRKMFIDTCVFPIHILYVISQMIKDVQEKHYTRVTLYLSRISVIVKKKMIRQCTVLQISGDVVADM